MPVEVTADAVGGDHAAEWTVRGTVPALTHYLGPGVRASPATDKDKISAAQHAVNVTHRCRPGG